MALVSLNGVVNFQMRPIGDLKALGAMASWGLYSVLVDKANARGVPPLTAIRKAFFWALVMMAPLAACFVLRSPKKQPEKCMSMTEKGKQCGNRPAEGKRYCSRHL